MAAVPPLGAQGFIKELKPRRNKPRPRSRPAVPDNKLWRLLETAYGKPYDQNRFTHTCLTARLMFCPEASPRAFMTNFQETYRCMVTHSGLYHCFDWVRVMLKLLEAEALANRNLSSDVPVESVVRATPCKHFVVDPRKWFAEKTTRDRVRARLAVVRAARRSHVSPLLLLLESDLVKFSLHGCP